MADENVKAQTVSVPSVNSKELLKVNEESIDECILLTSSSDDEEIKTKKDDEQVTIPDDSAMVPVDNNNEELLSKNPPEHDPSLLMKQGTEPKKVGTQNLFEAFSAGTPLLRQMVLFESDVILECKSCRNLFRNVNNFLDHKRMYCTDNIRSSCTLKEQMLMAQSQALWENHNRTAFVNAGEGDFDCAENRNPIANESKGIQVNLLADSSEPHLLLRDIPSTSEAIEQQVVIPRNIVYYDELDRSSAFQHVQLLHNDLDTTRLVGEITMRQVRRATLKNIEKRDSLHSNLQTANTDFYIDSDPQDAESDKGNIKKAKGKEKENSPIKKKEKKSPEALPSASLSKAFGAENEGTRGVPNKCKFCKKICKNWTALAWHMRIHKRRKYKCPLCHYETPALYRIKRHVMHVHNKDVKEVEEIVRVVVQKTHQINMSSSMETSANDTEPTCDVCSKVFSSKRNLVRHKEIHARKTKRAAGMMQKSKSDKRNTNHEEVEIARKNVFSIVDEKNLQCRRCKKTLSAWRRLVQHCCNHFGYNRYKCTGKGCPYENGDYTQMRRHMMCKHGRQFRSIQQISEAIRSMKVGIWVNFSLRTDRNETTDIESKADEKKLVIKKKNEHTKMNPKKSNAAPKKVSQKSPEQKKSPELKKSPSSDQKHESKKSWPEPKKNDDLSKSQQKTEDENSNNDANTSEEKKSGVKKVRQEKENASSSSQSSPTKDSPSPVRSSPRVNITPSYIRITPLRNVKDKQDAAGKKSTEKFEDGDKDRNSLMDRKNLKCLKCGKQFQYLSTLRRHVHRHFEPEKRVTVDKLQVGSKSSVYKLINLQDMRCLKCYKRFNDLSSVKRHVERHLGLHSFNCQFCGYISHNFTWFKRHLVLKHSHHIKDEKHLLQLVGQMKGSI